MILYLNIWNLWFSKPFVAEEKNNPRTVIDNAGIRFSLFFVYTGANFRPVDKLCPGKRLCRMEWERARKKTPFGVRRKLVSSFLSLMRLRKGGSGLPLPLFLAGKAWPNCSPIFALQMFLRSRSAVCAALFGTAGFPIHQYPPGSLSKNNCALCAWCGISQCTPSSPGRYRNPPFSNSKPTAALRTTE